MKKYSLLAVFCLSPVFTFAGNQDSGGGDVIICTKTNRNGQKIRKVYLADLYPLRNHKLFDEWNSLPGYLVHKRWMAMAEKLRPGFQKTFEKATRKINFEGKDVPYSQRNFEFPDLPDDNIVLDDPSCVKRQLAIQNFKTGEVTYNRTHYSHLSPVQKNLFTLHETLIFLRQEAGDTTPIRREVFEIALGENFDNFVLRSMGRVDKDAYVPVPDDHLELIKFVLYELWRVRTSDTQTSYERFLKRPYTALEGFEWGRRLDAILYEWMLHLNVPALHEDWLVEESKKHTSVESFARALAPRLIPEMSHTDRRAYIGLVNFRMPFYHQGVTKMLLENPPTPAPKAPKLRKGFKGIFFGKD